jgi:hypothetical protein
LLEIQHNRQTPNGEQTWYQIQGDTEKLTISIAMDHNLNTIMLNLLMSALHRGYICNTLALTVAEEDGHVRIALAAIEEGGEIIDLLWHQDAVDLPSHKDTRARRNLMRLWVNQIRKGLSGQWSPQEEPGARQNPVALPSPANPDHGHRIERLEATVAEQGIRIDYLTETLNEMRQDQPQQLSMFGNAPREIKAKDVGKLNIPSARSAENLSATHQHFLKKSKDTPAEVEEDPANDLPFE